MICRNCGTEVADKAIICYRCGTSTTEPLRKPADIRSKRGLLLPSVVLIFLTLAALFLGQAGQTTVPADYRVPAEVVLGTAIVVVTLRMIRRR